MLVVGVLVLPLYPVALHHGRWANEVKKLETGEITREEYDHWRYTYSAVEARRTRDELDTLRAKRKAAETEE